MATKKIQNNMDKGAIAGVDKMSSGKNGKLLSGIVVSDKMRDTIVVEVTRFVKHPKYDKYMKRSKKFKAHDAGNTAKIGQTVSILETKPMSKDKHFILK